MMIEYLNIWYDIEKIKQQSPLVHNITNFVVMHSTANALLAIGASPVMAHALEEVEEMTSLSNALVINIGTLSRSWLNSILKATDVANKIGIPVILDPVGSGATKFRTDAIRHILDNYKISILRGNASEIKSLISEKHKTKGVDSTISTDKIIEDAYILSDKYDLTVSVSGEVDIIVRSRKALKVLNGHKMMTKVTGMGCIATALTGAFAAVNNDYFFAAAEAMAIMGIAGEIAAEKSTGTGSMEVNFLDTIYNLDIKSIRERLRVESL